MLYCRKHRTHRAQRQCHECVIDRWARAGAKKLADQIDAELVAAMLRNTLVVGSITSGIAGREAVTFIKAPGRVKRS